jgi:gamma-D-glutamyl-L-lysine dipeptidyl-peptidase
MTRTPAAVVAAAAPLWASPDAAREVEAFDEPAYAGYRRWAARLLDGGTSPMGRLESVALCGEPVRVLDAADPSLLKVELPAQPNGSAGYVGYMSAAHVGVDARRRATHVVVTTTGPEPVELPAGATVEVRGAAQGLAEAVLASGAVVRCRTAALRPLDVTLGAEELLRIAMGFIGVRYLWGGIEGAGIDCSGLVHLAARIGGHVVPRDACDQWKATAIDATWEDVQPGDLLFFGDSASPEGITHVGLYAGEGRMLHAPEAGRPVTLEPIGAPIRERAVGFGRYREKAV